MTTREALATAHSLSHMPWCSSVHRCHIPFREISTRLTSQKIVETCRILRDFLLTVRPGVEPRIAMAGLNPHCEPIFGDEETVKIQPAIDQVSVALPCVFQRAATAWSTL